MSEQAETELPCGEHSQPGPWDPQRKWWQPSRLFNQDAGRPPLQEPWDPRWVNVDWLQRSLAACSWPGCMPAPLFVPYISGPTQHPSQKISREQCMWRVSLDATHFSPTEITVSVRRGLLEVEGKHAERPDEHGFTARCFTRKYRLPAEVDVTKMASTLSVDGILTVEAPLPETSVPASIIIPIKVEIEESEEQQDKHKREESSETDQDSGRASEAQRLLGKLQLEDHGKDSPLGVHGDEAPVGSSTAELQQHEESREQEEETHEKPAGESHPSLSADGEDIEICQDSPQHREAMETQESPDAISSKEPAREEAAVNGELQIRADSGEAAEQIGQREELKLGKRQPSEVQSQELEVPDIQQEHTE